MQKMYSDYYGDGRGIKYDGIWIDMNEPASFVAGRPSASGGNQGINGCPNNKWNRPPYVPNAMAEGR